MSRAAVTGNMGAEMNMPWEKTDGNDIPWFLRRDANNRAPFMDAADARRKLAAFREKYPDTAAVWASPSDSPQDSTQSEPLPWLATSSPRTA